MDESQDPLVVPSASPDAETIAPPGTPAAAPENVAIPGYELLRELGRGGMGVVYQARHKQLNRVVALKMILAGEHAGAEQRERFLDEARAVATLHHAGIVQVYEVGQHNGRPFMALEYVDGGSLADRLKDTPLPPRDAAATVEHLARAVQVAHSAGIVHRDLKPANILLRNNLATEDTENTEKSKERSAHASSSSVLSVSSVATSFPKITDFGLAKKVEGGSGLTRSGAILGTPSYMAPEQARGGKQVGPAADVYALGAILYECLTGRPPFRSASVMETLMLVVSAEPAPPSQLQPTTPLDLETIALKCLSKEPGKRYASALELADDLRRFLDGEPIRARPVGALERAAKWVKRRPALAGLLATIVLAAVTLFAAEVWFTLRLQQEKDNALAHEREAIDARDLADRSRLAEEEQRTRAERREAEAAALARLADERLQVARSSTYTWALGQAREQIERDPARAQVLLEDAVRMPLPLRDLAWQALYERSKALVCVLRGNEGSISMLTAPSQTNRALAGLAFSPDGRLLAVTDLWNNSSGVRIWEVPGGKELPGIKAQQADCFALAFAPDGKTLYTGGTKRGVVLWDVETGKEKAVWAECKSALFLALSGDGRWLAVPLSKSVLLFDTGTGKRLHTLEGHAGNVSTVAFSRDGAWLASAGSDNNVLLWKLGGLPDKAPTSAAIPVGRHVKDLAFSPDGKLLAVAEEGKEVRLWEVEGLRQRVSFTGHGHDVAFVAFAPDGQTVLSAAPQNELKRWDARTGKERTSWAPGSEQLMAFAVDPAGRHMALAAHLEGVVKVWSIADANDPVEQRLCDGAALACRSDGREFVRQRSVTATRVWAAAGGKEGAPLDGAVWHAPGSSPRLARLRPDGTLEVRDVDAGRVLLEIAAAGGVPPMNVEFLPGEQLLGVNRPGKPYEIWDIAGGKSVASFTRSAFPGLNLIAPDGRSHIQVRGAGKFQVELVGLPGLEARWQGDLGFQAGMATPLDATAFSGDGTTLVVLQGAEAVAIDTRTGKERARLKDAREARGVVVSPTGRWAALIAPPALKSVVTVWDTQGEGQPRRIECPDALAPVVQFTGDGGTVALKAATWLRLWSAASGKELAAFSWADQSKTGIPPVPPWALHGNRLAVLLPSGDLQVVDGTSGQSVGVLPGWPQPSRSPPGSSAVLFSPDGATVAATTPAGFCWWDIEQKKVLHRAPGSARLAFAPDGNSLATLGEQGLLVYRRDESRPATIDPAGAPVADEKLRYTGKHILVEGTESTLTFVVADGGEKRLQLPSLSGAVEHAAYSGDGERLALVTTRRLVQIRATRTGQLLSEWVAPKKPAAVALDRRGTRAALAYQEYVEITGADGAPALKVGCIGARLLAFAPDDAALATGVSHTGQVQLWGVDRGQRLAELATRTPTLLALAFSPDGRSLVTAHLETEGVRGPRPAPDAAAWRIKCSDPLTGQERLTFASLPITDAADRMALPFTTAALTLCDGRVSLFSRTGQGKTAVTRWAVAINTSRARLNLLGWGGTTRVLFTPDSQRILLADDDRVRVYDRATLTEQGAVTLSPMNTFGSAMATSLSANGDRLAVVGNDLPAADRAAERAEVYDLQTGRLLARFPEATGPLALSPDGTLLAATHSDPKERHIVLYDVAGGKRVADLPATARAFEVAFSADGKLLACITRPDQKPLLYDWGAHKEAPWPADPNGLLQAPGKPDVQGGPLWKFVISERLKAADWKPAGQQPMALTSDGKGVWMSYSTRTPGDPQTSFRWHEPNVWDLEAKAWRRPWQINAANPHAPTYCSPDGRTAYLIDGAGVLFWSLEAVP